MGAALVAAPLLFFMTSCEAASVTFVTFSVLLPKINFVPCNGTIFLGVASESEFLIFKCTSCHRAWN